MSGPHLIAVLLLATAASAAQAAERGPRWDDAVLATAGGVGLWVAADASELPSAGLLHTRIVLAARGPRMALVYPRWIPGTHAPCGPVENLGGLAMHDEQGRAVAWNRDPRDAWRFTVEVPAGARRLVIDLTYIANQPSAGSPGVDTYGGAHHGVLNWNTCLLLPEGADPARTACAAALRLPDGWQWASALTSADGADTDQPGVVRFASTSIEEVVDRPVLLGATVDRRRLRAADASGPEVLLNVVCDEPERALRDERWLVALGRLPDEACALFGGATGPRYDFLVLAGDDDTRFGLEHGSSALIAIDGRSLDFAAARTRDRYVMAHEFAHAWVGKRRRPAGMLAADYQAPPAFDGLWIYEGLTQHLGLVLAVRSGLATAEEWRREVAGDLRTLAALPGRAARRQRA